MDIIILVILVNELNWYNQVHDVDNMPYREECQNSPISAIETVRRVPFPSMNIGKNELTFTLPTNLTLLIFHGDEFLFFVLEMELLSAESQSVVSRVTAVGSVVARVVLGRRYRLVLVHGTRHVRNLMGGRTILESWSKTSLRNGPEVV